MEANKLSDTEFKRMVITMLKELIETYKELFGTTTVWKKEIGTINKNQEEMKSTISEIKNTLEGITRRLDEAEDWINEMEDRAKRNTQVEQLQEKRLKKYEYSLRELQDNIKRHNIRIIGIPEREEKKQGIDTLFEKMTENFPNLQRGKATQFQETQRVSIKMNP